MMRLLYRRRRATKRRQIKEMIRGFAFGMRVGTGEKKHRQE